MVDLPGKIAQIDELDEKRSNQAIRLFVIADQDIYADGLVRVISDYPQYQVVACVSPAEDCFQTFSESPGDILFVKQTILETRLSHKPVTDIFAQYREINPSLRIIVFDHVIDEHVIPRMLRAGVHGFIDGTMTRDSLAAVIQEVHEGGYWVGRKFLEELIFSKLEMEQIVEQGIQDKILSIQETLTQRENDVLRRILEGMSTKQIADDLYLSEQSVKLHLGRLFKKFEVSNRSQLILMAFQKVCPATNIINLFRKSLDRRRLEKGQAPIINDPMADLH